MNENLRIVLASRSPRRIELLERMGVSFEVIVSEVDERSSCTEPDELTVDLSMQKAMAVAEGIFAGKYSVSDGSSDEVGGSNCVFADTDEIRNGISDVLIIAADTVVSVGGQILGKPADTEQAREMMELLSGRSHEVFTGVTLLLLSGEQGSIVKEKSFACRTRVDVASMDEWEIEEYISTDEPYDKAGGYGIQGVFTKFIKGIEGDFFNVMGLPVHEVYEAMKELG